MVESNPFSYGNPISDPGKFIGRQRELHQVFSRLSNAAAESSSIVGERRIGKTSLLYQVLNRQVRKRFGVDSDHHLFIYCDLQMVDEKTTPVRLWQRLLRQLAQLCPDSEVKAQADATRFQEDLNTFALADLFTTLRAKDFRVVFLLDEFEKIISNINFTADFFFGLRSLAINYQIALITSTRKELIELTHSNEIRSSPFFNIFAMINLRPFNLQEAQDLIEKNLAGGDIRFTDDERNLILQLAGTHPYFLQVACYFLYEAYRQSLSASERVISTRKMFTNEAAAHFQNYWDDAEAHEKIVLIALALIEQQTKTDNRNHSLLRLQNIYGNADQILAHLSKRSLLVDDNQKITLINQAFADWVVREIADTTCDLDRYSEWLNENRGAIEQLGREGQKQMAEILPKIGARYRELIIGWALETKNLSVVSGLLKTGLSG